jgi:hypothetical protein
VHLCSSQSQLAGIDLGDANIFPPSATFRTDSPLELNRDKILQARKKRTMPDTAHVAELHAHRADGSQPARIQARLEGKVGGSADDGMARTAMSASPGAKAGEKAGAKPMARGAKASSTMERILPVAALSGAPCDSADRLLLYTVM